MTREQAINYLISRGLTQEQVGDVVRALTYKPRDCAKCKHYVVTDTRTNWGSQETTKIYGCERWECEYEPTTKNNLGVEEVTALAEWTEKLTKASEDAYNKGYADGMKAQEPILDKLRAEIKQLPDMDEAGVFSSVRMKSMVLDILDKYKAESEKA